MARFGVTSPVGVVQYFDTEWDAFIDIDDYNSLQNKMKIRCALIDSTARVVLQAIQLTPNTPANVQHGMASTLSLIDETPTTCKLYEPLSSCSLWPSPFVYPVHQLPASVTDALNNKLDLNSPKQRHARGLLVRTLCVEAVELKSHPDYLQKVELAKSIIAAWPYLAESVGRGYDGWLSSIIDCLKVVRQQKGKTDARRSAACRKRRLCDEIETSNAAVKIQQPLLSALQCRSKTSALPKRYVVRQKVTDVSKNIPKEHISVTSDVFTLATSAANPTVSVNTWESSSPRTVLYESQCDLECDDHSSDKLCSKEIAVDSTTSRGMDGVETVKLNSTVNSAGLSTFIDISHCVTNSLLVLSAEVPNSNCNGLAVEDEYEVGNERFDMSMLSYLSSAVCAEEEMNSIADATSLRREIMDSSATTERLVGDCSVSSDSPVEHGEKTLAELLDDLNELWNSAEGQRNSHKMLSLLKRTFDDRRALVHRSTSTSAVKKLYPSLFFREGIVQEYELITNSSYNKSVGHSNFMTKAPELVDKARSVLSNLLHVASKKAAKKRDTIQTILTKLQLTLDDETDVECQQTLKAIAGLMLLPVLLDDTSSYFYKVYDVSSTEYFFTNPYLCIRTVFTVTCVQTFDDRRSLSS